VLAIRGIGEETPGAVVAEPGDRRERDPLARLEARGVNMSEPRASTAGTAFEGRTFVVTGTLPGLSRSQATALIESQGGRVTSGVSKATSYVVVGEDAGSKLEKATALGLTLLSESELVAMATPGAWTLD
jgi:DNA ligase (NAD+)